MDIWRWVWEVQDRLEDDGQKRLVEIMEALPKEISAGNQEIAEAMLPEGLALAREVDNPWIEVFLRHWICQGRFLFHSDVTQGLPEVVSLVDFAHGERTRDCPQSVCVVQDICVAYEILDGPGYAADRIAASREALDRIDITWQCQSCIGGEHADALRDAGLYAEAERFCREQIALREKHTRKPEWHLRLSLADALSAQGKYVDAVLALDEPRVEPASTHRRLLKTLRICRDLTLAGQIEKAVKYMVDTEQLEPGHYYLWAITADGLVRAGVMPNDAKLDTTLQGMVGKLRAKGGVYRPAEMAVIAARLAAARRDPVAVSQHLREAEEIIPRLRKPEPLRAAIAEIRVAG